MTARANEARLADEFETEGDPGRVSPQGEGAPEAAPGDDPTGGAHAPDADGEPGAEARPMLGEFDQPDGSILRFFHNRTWEHVDPNTGEIIAEGVLLAAAGDATDAPAEAVRIENDAKGVRLVTVDGRALDIPEPWFSDLVEGVALVSASSRRAGADGMAVEFQFKVKAK